MDEAVMTVRMRGLREDHDYTQKYVAYKIGIDQRTYSVYETGKRSMPVRRLYMLCELIVSSFFRKFNFCHLVSGSQPAMISDSSSSSGLER